MIKTLAEMALNRDSLGDMPASARCQRPAAVPLQASPVRTLVLEAQKLKGTGSDLGFGKNMKK